MLKNLQDDKFRRGIFIITGMVMAVGLIAAVCFSLTVLWGYVETKDYEETTCQLIGPKRALYEEETGKMEKTIKKANIWCSCNDHSKLMKRCVDKPYQIPCMQLWVYTVDDSGTRYDTWLKRYDIHQRKGVNCTNTCENPDVYYLIGMSEREVKCYYEASAPWKQAYLHVSTFWEAFHSVFWPLMVFMWGFILCIVSLIIYLICRKRGKQSYA